MFQTQTLNLWRVLGKWIKGTEVGLWKIGDEGFEGEGGNGWLGKKGAEMRVRKVERRS